MNILLDIYATLIGAKCFVCKKEHLNICSDCLNKLPKIDFPFCMGCDLLSIDGKTHLYCQRSCKIENHVSSFIYAGEIKKILLIYKNNRSNSHVIDTVVSYALKDLRNNIMNVDYVVPFPKTPKIIENGEQSLPELIANKVNKIYKINMLGVVGKSSKVKQKERQSTHRAAIKYDIFIIPEMIEAIQGKSVLLVDDITTTGSSIRAAGKLLSKVGVKSVNSYTLAKDLRYN